MSRQVHRERVVGFSPSWNAASARSARAITSQRSNARVEVAPDERAHLLRLDVVGVVVAGRQRVGAEHDAALHLGAEARVARRLVHRRAGPSPSDAQAVAHAVVARQVRRRLGRRDEVVGRRSRSSRVRQLELDDLGAERRGRLDRRLERAAHAGLERRRRSSSLRHADAQARRSSPLGQRDRLGQRRRARRVARVVGRRSTPSRQRDVAHVARTARPGRATTRTRRGRSAMTRPYVGLSPTTPQKRGGLADRAAGVGAERERREAGRDRRRRAAATTRPARASRSHGLRVGPKAEFSVDEPIANSSMFVLPTEHRAGRRQRARRRRRRTAARSPRGCASRRSSGCRACESMSLSAIGTPAGRCGRARRARAARASVCSRVHVQEGVHVAVVRRDALQVRRGQLLGRELSRVEQRQGALGPSAPMVEIAAIALAPIGGTRKPSGAGSGAFTQGVLVRRGDGSRLVLGQHVDEVERVRGRGHAREVELRDVADVRRGCAPARRAAARPRPRRARGARAARRAGRRSRSGPWRPAW